MKNRILKIEAGLNIDDKPISSQVVQAFNNKVILMLESSIARIRNGKKSDNYTSESPATLTAEIASYQVLGKEPPEELITAFNSVCIGRNINKNLALKLLFAFLEASNN